MSDANANMTSEGKATNQMFEAPTTDNGLMDEVNSFIAGLEDDIVEENAANESGEVDETGQSATNEGVEDSGGAVVPSTKPDEPGMAGGTKSDPGLARLLAREQEVANKERDFDKRVEAAVLAKTPSLKGKSHEDVLKMAGFDPELVLKQMMYERASDTNPVKAKLKDELRDLHHRKEIESVRAELEKRDAQRAQQEYFQSINDGARQYVTTKVDEKVLPTFALVAKTKPDKMHARVMQVITQDAASRLAKGEDGEPMAYADAAKAVEAELAELAEVIKAGMSGSNTQKKVAATIKASKQPVLNQPIIKKSPSQEVDDEIQTAIQASIGIFHAEEAKAKGVRRK